jgi:hypothetical protein
MRSIELMGTMDGWSWRNGKIDNMSEVVLGWFGKIVAKMTEDMMVSTIGDESFIAWCG